MVWYYDFGLIIDYDFYEGFHDQTSSQNNLLRLCVYTYQVQVNVFWDLIKKPVQFSEVVLSNFDILGLDPPTRPYSHPPCRTHADLSSGSSFIDSNEFQFAISFEIWSGEPF